MMDTTTSQRYCQYLGEDISPISVNDIRYRRYSQVVVFSGPNQHQQQGKETLYQAGEIQKQFRSSYSSWSNEM